MITWPLQRLAPPKPTILLGSEFMHKLICNSMGQSTDFFKKSTHEFERNEYCTTANKAYQRETDPTKKGTNQVVYQLFSIFDTRTVSPF